MGRHIKFVDDSVIASLLSYNSLDYGPVSKEFKDWCISFPLHINVEKTKEMVDFRKISRPIFLLSSRTKQWSWMGTHIDDKLTIESKVDAVLQKGSPAHAFLQEVT